MARPSPPLRMLLNTDGSVTALLEASFCAPVAVETRSNAVDGGRLHRPAVPRLASDGRMLPRAMGCPLIAKPATAPPKSSRVGRGHHCLAGGRGATRRIRDGTMTGCHASKVARPIEEEAERAREALQPASRRAGRGGEPDRLDGPLDDARPRTPPDRGPRRLPRGPCARRRGADRPRGHGRASFRPPDAAQPGRLPPGNRAEAGAPCRGRSRARNASLRAALPRRAGAPAPLARPRSRPARSRVRASMSSRARSRGRRSTRSSRASRGRRSWPRRRGSTGSRSRPRTSISPRSSSRPD
jgi:hypothetical protein